MEKPPRRDVRSRLRPLCGLRVARRAPPCLPCFNSLPGVPVVPLGLPSPPSSDPPTPTGFRRIAPPYPPQAGDCPPNTPRGGACAAGFAPSVVSVSPAGRLRAFRVSHLRALSVSPAGCLRALCVSLWISDNSVKKRSLGAIVLPVAARSGMEIWRKGSLPVGNQPVSQPQHPRRFKNNDQDWHQWFRAYWPHGLPRRRGQLR